VRLQIHMTGLTNVTLVQYVKLHCHVYSATSENFSSFSEI